MLVMLFVAQLFRPFVVHPAHHLRGYTQVTVHLRLLRFLNFLASAICVTNFTHTKKFLNFIVGVISKAQHLKVQNTSPLKPSQLSIEHIAEVIIITIQ